MKYDFGKKDGFLKNAIYEYLLNNGDKYGMFNIILGDNKRDNEDLYSIGNAIHKDIEVDNKNILAVLYKIKFDWKKMQSGQNDYMDNGIEQQVEENIK